MVEIERLDSNDEHISPLERLKRRFLLTQAGSILASVTAETIRHSAMSFSSLLMEAADFLISKATSYGCDPKADDKSRFLGLIEKLSGNNRELATQRIRVAAYAGHIAVAGVGAYESARLLGDSFEAPGPANLAIMALAAAINAYNFFDARKQQEEQDDNTGIAMSLSGIRAMARTNFAEVSGLVAGVALSPVWPRAGNWAVMASSVSVAWIMGKQIIREVRQRPD